MKSSTIRICLVAVISLMASAIWQVPASVAGIPSIESLGEIREGLAAPGRLDVDSAGNLYVVDGRKTTVFKYDKLGNLVASFNSVPVSGGGVAVTPDGSRVYVAGRDVVSVIDGSTGAVIGQLGSGKGEFVSVGEIDLDGAGYVFVADPSTKFVKVYDPAGNFQYQFGGLGIAAGQFRTIWAMSVNEQAGEVYVADVATYSTSLPKIQVFDLSGTQVLRTLYASSGLGLPEINAFGGITFDRSGRGYFLDSLGGQFRILELPSTYLNNYANGGYGVGQVSGARDAVYDPSTGRLFLVCDGARIEVFGIDGAQNPSSNAAPGSPVPQAPVDDSEVADAMPRLQYLNAEDPDGDSLTYNVQVFEGEAVVAEYVGLPQGDGSSFATVDVALKENSRYLWRVQADDGKLASSWTELQSFYVNANQEPPSVPALVSPLSGETLDGKGILSWLPAVDADPFDTVGYVVEIDTDATFAAPLVTESVVGTSVSLGDLAGYKELEDGVSYLWRVRAVDNHDISSDGSAEGTFLYDTTLLKVASNMPGAKVYLGGNHGYAGRFLGVAPLELRDFPVGIASVVVERAGFEPWIVQVSPGDKDNVEVYANLVPSIASADLKARPVQAAGADIILGGDASPFAVDYDNDGLTDLLVSEASGALSLYKKVISVEGIESFAQAEPVALPLVPGAAPFVVDWNNDGLKDILVGGSDGTVTLFTNIGFEDAPLFDGGSLLQVSGAPIAVGAAAVPVVIDLDGDGAKDLVVGSGFGSVRVFVNGGSDAAPELTPARILVSLSGAVAPFFVDWDGDGSRELLIAANEHLYRYVRKVGEDAFAFVPVEVFAVGSDLVNDNSGKSSTGSYSMGDRLRLFAYDADGGKGKDLVVGNAAGEVRMVSSHGSTVVSAFALALLDKVAQIDDMIQAGTPEQALVDAVAADIGKSDLKAAVKTVKDLAVAVEGTECAKSVAELDELLRY